MRWYFFMNSFGFDSFFELLFPFLVSNLVHGQQVGRIRLLKLEKCKHASIKNGLFVRIAELLNAYNEDLKSDPASELKSFARLVITDGKTYMKNVGSLSDCVASLVELARQVFGRLAWIMHGHGHHGVHSLLVKVLQRVSVRFV